jgi:hypothetical protein
MTALAVELRLTPASEGGRSRGLGPFGKETLQYRPNWGFRGLNHPHEQAGAPVLCWQNDRIEPGDTVRAVIIPMFPETWRDVAPGDDLAMYEGPKVCGKATVLWREDVIWPLDDSQVDLFRAWARTGSRASQQG